ncbi:MAG: ferredoxin [Pseudonocardiaceae bacterium]|nr:ferredoxin [Pseudonocardiaceae bacterium]
MKISVDNDVCEAHGHCNIVDRELFPLDEDGYSDVGQGKQVPAGKEGLAEQGVEICPVLALRIDEDDAGIG